jgi:hypothetical protein
MAKAKTDSTEIPENERPAEEMDIAAEFAALGKKFAEAMRTAWHSEERVRLQSDIKDGLERFTAEVDGAFRDLRRSDVSKKVGEGVQQVAADVKSGKALDRMAGGFTPADEEKEAAPKK